LIQESQVLGPLSVGANRILAVSKGKGAKYEHDDTYPAYKPKDKPIGFDVEEGKHRETYAL
jgi:hypothetical protein